MSWPMVRLGDVAPATPIKNVNLNEDELIWQLNLDQVESNTGKIIDKVKQPLSSAGSSTHFFNNEHVLYSKLRPYLNKVVVPDELGIATTELVPMKPDQKRLNKKYLAYYLRSKPFAEWISTQVSGAKMPRVVMSVFWQHEMPLPPLDEQERIVSILDKSDGIRQKREQAIKVANDYLYSVFLDMFGDPVMNPNGFEIRVLSDFFIDEKNGTKCGPFGSALKKDEYTREGVPVWNMDNITLKGDFIDLPFLWVSENKYQALESYSVLDGDVIISRAGTVGKMGVVRSSTEKSIISTNLIRVRFGGKLHPEYFVSLMTYCKGRVGNLKTGPDGTFTHMNTGVLSNLEFPYPPLELQKKYIKIRQSVMRIIDKYHHSGFVIDEKFCAINHKAFLCQP